MENDSYEKGFVHENKKVAAELFYSYSFVKRIKVNQIKRSLNTFSNNYGDLLVQCLGSTNCIFNVKVCNTEEATYSHYKPKCKPKQVLQK